MADPSQLPPLPKDHLSHPENWATGSEPATSKQKGFIKVLEGQHSDLIPEEGLKVDDLGKSEASEVIEKLKAGVEVDVPGKVSGGDGENEMKVGRKELEEMQEGNGETGEDGQEGKKLNGSTKRKSANEKEDEVVKDKVAVDKEGKGDTASNGKGDKSKQGTLDASLTSTNGKSSTTTKTKSTKEKDADGKSNEKNGHAEEEKEDATEATSGEKNGHNEDEDKEEKGEKEERASKKARTEPNQSPAKGDKSEPIEIDSPTEAEPSTTTTTTNGNGNSSTIPGDNAHLDHPENWTTGDEPATAKQKGFLKVLEGQKGVTVEDVEVLGKSEASEKIDELKKM